VPAQEGLRAVEDREIVGDRVDRDQRDMWPDLTSASFHGNLLGFAELRTRGPVEVKIRDT
jgi:hypothetical protein